MMPQPLTAPLVPELDVTDLDDSLQFYVDIVGFGVVFERRAERLAYLALEDAELMLQEAAGRDGGSAPPHWNGPSVAA